MNDAPKDVDDNVGVASSDIPEEEGYLAHPKLLPTESIHILAGSPHAGKSTLIAQLVSIFLSPESNIFPGIKFSQLQPEEIGFIFTDRKLKDNSVWINEFGLEDCPVYSVPDEDEAIERLDSYAEHKNRSYGADFFKFCLSKLKAKQPKVKLVIVDVLTTFCVGGNIQDSSIVYRHMMRLLQATTKEHITLLGVAYGSKQKSGEDKFLRLIDRIIGAAPLRGSTTDLLYLASTEETGSESKYQELHWQGRFTKLHKFALQHNSDGPGFYVDTSQILEDDNIKSEPDVDKDTKKLETAQSVLLPILYEQEESSLSVIQAKMLLVKKISRATLFRYLTLLTESGQIEKTKHGKYKIKMAVVSN